MSDNSAPQDTTTNKNDHMVNVLEYDNNFTTPYVQKMNEWKKSNEHSRKTHPMDLSYLIE